MEKITVFHGTTSNYLPEIEANGLVPKAKPGNDAHWKQAAKWNKRPSADARAQSVYISPDPDIAALFATRAAKLYGGKPAVVELHLPDDWKAHLHIDEAGGDDFDAIDYLRYQAPLPASCIVAAKTIKPIHGVKIT